MINRVFALISQEVQQRAISSVSSTSAPSSVASMTFLVRGSSQASNSSSFAPNRSFSSNQGKRKEKPVCTHCGLSGHTVDHCYKLHGYPPGYRTSDNWNSQPHSTSSVKAAESSSKSSSVVIPDSLSNISADQC